MKNLVQMVIITIIATLTFAIFNQSSIATDVGGIIGSDTTWDLAGSPYNFISNVQVDENVTLTIEPGVIVNGGNGFEYFRFQVWGHIVAIGSDSEKITFNDVAGISHFPQSYSCLATSTLRFVRVNCENAVCLFDIFGDLILKESEIQTVNNRGFSVWYTKGHIENNLFKNNGCIVSKESGQIKAIG